MNCMTITDKDAAESIAAEVERATGMDCKAFSNETGSVIVCDRTAVIARVTELSPVVRVAPLGGPFVGEVTEIPLKARNIDGIREIANALDTATSHVLNAAMNR